MSLHQQFFNLSWHARVQPSVKFGENHSYFTLLSRDGLSSSNLPLSPYRFIMLLNLPV